MKNRYSLLLLIILISSLIYMTNVHSISYNDSLTIKTNNVLNLADNQDKSESFKLQSQIIANEGIEVLWPIQGYYYITDYMQLFLTAPEMKICQYNFNNKGFEDMEYAEGNYSSYIYDLEDNMANPQPYIVDFKCIDETGSEFYSSTYFWINTSVLDSYFLRENFGQMKYLVSEINGFGDSENGILNEYIALYGIIEEDKYNSIIITIFDDMGYIETYSDNILEGAEYEIVDNAVYANNINNQIKYVLWQNDNRLVQFIAYYVNQSNPQIDEDMLDYYLEKYKPNDTFKPCNEEICEHKYIMPDIDDDAILGDPYAPITIIEFGGYQDPFSERFWRESFPYLKEKYIDTGMVRYVFRDFPLNTIQPLSWPSAEAAECVKEYGGDEAYWNMHNDLFENQNVLSYAKIIQLAQNRGYNIEECLNSKEKFDEVSGDYSDGQNAGIRGTPTFFINGQIISGALSITAYEKVINEEISKNTICLSNNDCGLNNDQPYCSQENNVYSSYTNYTCINPGSIWSYCEIKINNHIMEMCNGGCYNGECIECSYGSDCDDGNERTEDICKKPGTTDSFCENNIIPIFLSVNDPHAGTYEERKIQFNLSINEQVDQIIYVDNTEYRARERTLCKRNCRGYGDERTILRSFNDGFHNITFKAIKNDEMVYEKTVEFIIDSRNPRISKTEPRRGFASGIFNVEFIEDNPEELILFYGNSIMNKTLDFQKDCILDRTRYKCQTEVDLDDFDGQEMPYYFELKDVVGNSDISRGTTLDVDTTYPVLNNPNSFWNQGDGRYEKYIYFTFNVTELHFDEINYVDWSESRPIERRLCSRLGDGICEVKKSFRIGEHNLTINILDDAGNWVSYALEFYV